MKKQCAFLAGVKVKRVRRVGERVREMNRKVTREREKREMETHLQHSNVVEHEDGQVRLRQGPAPSLAGLKQRSYHSTKHRVHEARVFRVCVGRLQRQGSAVRPQHLLHLPRALTGLVASCKVKGIGRGRRDEGLCLVLEGRSEQPFALQKPPTHRRMHGIFQRQHGKESPVVKG